MKYIKTITSFFLFAVFLMAYSAEDAQDKPMLKVLDIGNSFTNGATDLLPQIVDASGSDVSNICLYKTIRSSGRLKKWYDVYCDKDTAYTYRIEKVHGGLSANVTV